MSELSPFSGELSDPVPRLLPDAVEDDACPCSRDETGSVIIFHQDCPTHWPAVPPQKRTSRTRTGDAFALTPKALARYALHELNKAGATPHGPTDEQTMERVMRHVLKLTREQKAKEAPSTVGRSSRFNAVLVSLFTQVEHELPGILGAVGLSFPHRVDCSFTFPDEQQGVGPFMSLSFDTMERSPGVFGPVDGDFIHVDPHLHPGSMPFSYRISLGSTSENVVIERDDDARFIRDAGLEIRRFIEVAVRRYLGRTAAP